MILKSLGLQIENVESKDGKIWVLEDLETLTLMACIACETNSLFKLFLVAFSVCFFLIKNSIIITNITKDRSFVI